MLSTDNGHAIHFCGGHTVTVLSFMIKVPFGELPWVMQACTAFFA